MNRYEERIERMERHLSVHPADYQTVISLLKLKSALIVKKRVAHCHLMRKKIAYFKAQEAR